MKTALQYIMPIKYQNTVPMHITISLSHLKYMHARTHTHTQMHTHTHMHSSYSLSLPLSLPHAYTFETVKVVIAITVHTLLCIKETLQKQNSPNECPQFLVH